MIKTIIFDMDGVLCDLVEAHRIALNRAIWEIAGNQFVINDDDQIKYNGLPTKVKLNKLISDKNLPHHLLNDISDLKQKYTLDAISDSLTPSKDLIKTLTALKERYVLICASNSIKETIIKALSKMEILSFFDHILSNEDVKLSKPSPEIYLKAFIASNSYPKECVIVEDSQHGREAAVKSGAHVCDVNNVEDTTLERIVSFISSIEKTKVKWSAKNSLNVLIPCAGAGSRFASAGYKKPKPLVDIQGLPMLKTVVDNLNIDANYIFVVQKDHYDKYHLDTILPLIAPNCKIVCVEGLTEGAACTSLLAKEFIDNDNHLLIANSDQFVEWESPDFFWHALSKKLDGLILTFKASGNKWSYVKLDGDYVVDVQEKVEISDIATVGIYYFNKGSEYVKYAQQMIDNKIKHNNEYYIAPVYNEMIKDNKKIGIKYCDKMYGLGTPEDLEYFFKVKLE